MRLFEESLREVRSAKQESEQMSRSDIQTLNNRLREHQTSITRKDEQLEQLRFAYRSLQVEVAELRKDSACMGQMLEEEATKADKVDDKQRSIQITQTELKMQKQELETEREKLLIQISANQKLSLELKEKQEQVDQELEHRINNIMQNERHEHERALKSAEREIFEVNRTLATVQASIEKKQKDMLALQQEYDAMAKKVTVLFEEKANLSIEVHNKVENERRIADSAARE